MKFIIVEAIDPTIFRKSVKLGTKQAAPVTINKIKDLAITFFNLIF